MTKKTTTLYDRVILKIKEILPFTPTEIMTDYEDALFHALSVNYPNVRAEGCMLHHDQALYKTGILKNGLSDLYLTNREFRNWAELLLSLPLLPSNKIVDIYQYLKHKKPILSQIDDEKLAKLFQYYEKHWLGDIGTSRISVFQSERRTNNDLENFHGNLKKKFKSHNPNFWDFIKNLNKIVKTNEKDMERIDNNVAIRRKPRPIVIQKEQVIADLQRKLSLGEINPLKYLTEMSYQYKTGFKKFEALLPSTDDEIGDLTEIDGIVVATPTNSVPQLSVNERLCRVCLINEVDTLILPCRHIQTCYRCTEIISTEESPRCPVCRGTVEQVLQVFL